MKRIPLRARDGSVRAYALVDDGDYEWLSAGHFRLHSHGYAVGMGDQYMHALVVERRDGRRAERVHHDDEDPLNNQRANLIAMTHAEHQAHHHRHTGRGYHWHAGKWDVMVRTESGRRVYLGRFATEAEAAAVVAAHREAIAHGP